MLDQQSTGTGPAGPQPAPTPADASSQQPLRTAIEEVDHDVVLWIPQAALAALFAMAGVMGAAAVIAWGRFDPHAL